MANSIKLFNLQGLSLKAEAVAPYFATPFGRVELSLGNRSRGQVLENKGFRGVKGRFYSPKRHVSLAKPLKNKALTP